MDHDRTSSLGVPVAPEQVATPAPRASTSTYDAGPTGSPQLYGPADRDKFLVKSGRLFEDLPSTSNNRAILADKRNDENPDARRARW